VALRDLQSSRRFPTTLATGHRLPHNASPKGILSNNQIEIKLHEMPERVYSGTYGKVTRTATSSQNHRIVLLLSSSYREPERRGSATEPSPTP